MLLDGQKVPTRLLLILSILPAVAFFFYLYANAQNVPYMDDIELIITINTIKRFPQHFLDVLVSQQNDHRSAFSRMGILASYFISGYANFRLTILLGFGNLVLLTLGLFAIYKRNSKDMLAFLPVTLLLFSPIIFVDHFWSLVAFQHTLSIAFSILCLYTLQKEKDSLFWWSMPLLICASLTNLDGIFLLPFALLWLTLQRRWRQVFLFAGFAVIYLWVYFKDFAFYSKAGDPFSVQWVLRTLEGFIILIGSVAKIFSNTYQILLSKTVGIMMLLAYAVCKIIDFIRSGRKWSSFANSISFAEICLLRIWGSMFIIAVARANEGLDNMVAERFQIYAVSGLILFYLFVCSRITFPFIIKMGIALVAAAINLMAYGKNDASVKFLKAGLLADAYNYPAHHQFLHQNFNLVERPVSFYRFYRFPKFITADLAASTTLEYHPYSIKMTEDSLWAKGHQYLDRGLQFEVQTEQPLKQDVTFLLLQPIKTHQKPYLIALWNPNTRLSSRSGNTLSSLVTPAKFPRGFYNVSLCWPADGKIIRAGKGEVMEL